MLRGDPCKGQKNHFRYRIYGYQKLHIHKTKSELKMVCKNVISSPSYYSKTIKNSFFGREYIFWWFFVLYSDWDDIFGNRFFSWLSFIHTQLLICINWISEVIFLSPSKGPPFAFSKSTFFCGTLYTSLNEKCDTSLELSCKLSTHIQYPEGSE